LRDKHKKQELLDFIQRILWQWSGESEWIPSSYLLATQRVSQWQQQRKPFPVSLVSIGRLTDQKVSLLRTNMQSDSNKQEDCAVDKILRAIGDGIFIMVGTGTSDYEQFFTQLMRKHKNFLYLQGFSEELAAQLYGAADLFLMPSSFEPCGISQMLAMRAGTPCIVHGVGGLKDTVTDGLNGFVFNGNSVQSQLSNMLNCINSACILAQQDSESWHLIKNNAGATRFLWDDAIDQYLEKLYATS
jgi:starch synthase